MYSAWKITIGQTGEEVIIWGSEKKVDEYRRENLENEDYGGGFEKRMSIDEITYIVDGLRVNYPNAREVMLP